MSEHPIASVQEVGEIVAGHMHAILALFKPGAKITVLVRRPEAPDGSRDFLQTNDALDEIIEAVRRRKDPAKTLTGNT